MRRVLSFVLSFCFLCSALCGVVYGAEWISIDDMGIDPWSDLEAVQGIPRPQEGIALLEDDDSVEDVYAFADDVMLLSEQEGGGGFEVMSLSGFLGKGTDDDGDSWTGTSTLSTYTFPISSGSFVGTSPQIGPATTTTRLYNLGSSKLAWYLGRPAIISGDPEITIRTTIYFEGGQVHFGTGDSYAGDNGVTSFQFQDVKFSFALGIAGSKSYTSFTPELIATKNYSTDADIAPYEGAYLYINGEKADRLLTSYTTKNYGGVTYYDIDINNQVLEITKQNVYSYEVVFEFGALAGKSQRLSYPGGFCVCPSLHNGNNVVNASANVSLTVDSNAAIEEQTGLLKSIIAIITNIKDGIVGIASAIAALPGKIANLIIDGLKSLFIPSDDDIAEISGKWQLLLSEKFGFIYQIYSEVQYFFNTLVDSWGTHSDYQFQFPEISFTMQGTKYLIIASQPLSLDNALMDILRPCAGTIFSFIFALGVFHSLETMIIAIMSGKNYFDYLHRRDEEENE